MAVPGQVGPPDEPPLRGPYATRAEVEARLDALTPGQKAGLLQWARYIAKKSGNKNGDGEDLLSTAILKMLLEPPERKWYSQQIEFFPFVMGSIKSIGSSWFNSAGRSGRPDIDAPGTSEEKQREASLIVNEMRAYLAAHSDEHPHAVGIFDLIADSYTGSEIQKQLGIAPNVYEATLKWMRRTLKREDYRP